MCELEQQYECSRAGERVSEDEEKKRKTEVWAVYVFSGPACATQQRAQQLHVGMMMANPPR